MVSEAGGRGLQGKKYSIMKMPTFLDIILYCGRPSREEEDRVGGEGLVSTTRDTIERIKNTT